MGVTNSGGNQRATARPAWPPPRLGVPLGRGGGVLHSKGSTAVKWESAAPKGFS